MLGVYYKKKVNMNWILWQGVLGDVGERGPPGPDGKEVRAPLCS